MKATVLITGGAGYIGSHIGYLLAQHDYSVIFIDDFLHNQPNPSFANVVRGTLNDQSFLNTLLSSYPIDAVIHCAALCDIAHSIKNPLAFYQNNVGSTLSLLQSISRAGIKKIIFSSSCSVYGNPQEELLAEDHPKNPLSPYGKSKLIAEEIIKDICNAQGIRAIIFRYFNVAGAMPEYGLYEWHKPETHIIPRLLEAVRSGISFTLYGNDFPTADGTAVRDFIHVWDIAHAHLLALEKLNQGYPGDSFNLGTGHGHSVKELIHMIEKIQKKKIQVQLACKRSGDAAQLIADPRRAHQILGWRPRFSDLSFILRSALVSYEYMMQAHNYQIITSLT